MIRELLHDAFREPVTEDSRFTVYAARNAVLWAIVCLLNLALFVVLLVKLT